MKDAVRRARAAPWIAIDTETFVAPDSPIAVDPIRSTLVGISIAVAPGEAFYFPFRHRTARGPAQGDLLPAVAPGGGRRRRTCRRSTRRRWRPLRELIEDETVRKTAQNGKYDLLVLRRAGITLRGLDFDTMLASYVLDPGRRSHGLDMLALEFLERRTTSYDELVGKGARREDLRSGADRRGARLLLRGCGRHPPAPAAVRAGARSARPHARCCATWRCRSSACSPTWSGRGSGSTAPGSRR